MSSISQNMQKIFQFFFYYNWLWTLILYTRQDKCAPESYALSGSCPMSACVVCVSVQFLHGLRKESGSPSTWVWRQGKGCCFFKCTAACHHAVTSPPFRQQGKEPSTDVRQVVAASGASASHGVLPGPGGDLRYT